MYVRGEGNLLMKRTGRPLLVLGVLSGAWLALTFWPLFGFFEGYWPQLTHLSARVQAIDAAHGARFVSLQRVSPWVSRALIATEDRTFYSNLGVSVAGIGRSLLVDLQRGQYAQGGSTLTQQLVRDTLLSPVKTFRRKVSEALLSLLATQVYSKQQILTLYLNEVYLGDGAYGIQAASERYFGIPPSRLNAAEASLLAGLPQAPSAYDPFIHYRRAKIRQWAVLLSMVSDHVISLQVARRIYRAPLPFRGRLNTTAHQGGHAKA